MFMGDETHWAGDGTRVGARRRRGGVGADRASVLWEEVPSRGAGREDRGDKATETALCAGQLAWRRGGATAIGPDAHLTVRRGGMRRIVGTGTRGAQRG